MSLFSELSLQSGIRCVLFSSARRLGNNLMYYTAFASFLACYLPYRLLPTHLHTGWSLLAWRIRTAYFFLVFTFRGFFVHILT
ncbi:hypothetical protein BDV06DRAFT_27601 [Aspergillus oleicola]